MKKLFFILFICLSTSLIYAQKGKVDQIIKSNGVTIKAKVVSYKGDKVTYQLPGESFVMQINKKDLRKIIFHNGEVIEFSMADEPEEIPDNEPDVKVDKKPVIVENSIDKKAELDSLDWVDIIVTEDPGDVANAKEISAITGFAEGGKLNTPTSVLLSNAIVDLKMEAALIGANKVLIKEINHTRGYGDLPTTLIEAVAFRE